MGICKGIGTAEMSVRVEGFGDDLVRSEETYGCQHYPLTTFQAGLIEINQLSHAGGMALLSCLSHRGCSRATQMDSRECKDCAEQKGVVQRMARHFFCEALECIAQVILRSQARNVVLEEPGSRRFFQSHPRIRCVEGRYILSIGSGVVLELYDSRAVTVPAGGLTPIADWQPFIACDPSELEWQEGSWNCRLTFQLSPPACETELRVSTLP